METPFKKYLLFSLCLHLGVLIVFSFFETTYPKPPKPTEVLYFNLSPKKGLPTGSPKAPPGIRQTQKTKPSPQAKTQDADKVEPAKILKEPKVETSKIAEPKITESLTKEPKPEKTKAEKPKVVKKTFDKKNQEDSIQLKDQVPPQDKKPKKTSQKSTGSKPLSKKKKTSLSSEQEKAIAQALSGIEESLEARNIESQHGQSGDSQIPSAIGNPEGSVQAQDPGYVAYQGQVKSHITRHWIRTHGQSNQSHLTARLQVKIDPQGQVISKKFVQKSGDSSFDNSVLRALNKASPLPIPPPSLLSEATREGFIVDFSTRVLKN